MPLFEAAMCALGEGFNPGDEQIHTLERQKRGVIVSLSFYLSGRVPFFSHASRSS
jgi:hypothetical protein